MISLPVKNKLITKFLYTYIPLAFIPLLIIGILMITAVQDSLRESIEDTHREIAKIAADEISLFVKNSKTNIKTLTYIPQLREMDNKFEINTIINEFIEEEKTEEKTFKKIMIIDKDGKVFSTTSFLPDTSDYSNDTFFIQSITGNDYISPLIIDETLPYIIISVPIKYLNNIRAVLMAEVNVKSIWDLVESISFLDEGRIMLVNKDGTLIAHSNVDRVYSNENLGDLEIVKSLFNGLSGTGRFTDKDDIEMISYFDLIREGLDWGLITYQPVDKAYRYSRQMTMQFSLILILTTFVAIIISIVITRTLLKPIKELVSGVKEFSSGNLDYMIETKEINEIGLLANEFNKMTSSIKDYQKKLKQAERLATLSKFASVVAHEIRNPLNAMMINLEMVRRDFQKNTYNENIQKFVEIIYSEILRMDELVKNYLALSKPSPLNLTVEKLDILLDEVIISNQANALSQGVRIERNFTLTPALKIDKNQIKQVFLNIILNALQAMPGGGKLVIYIFNSKTFNTTLESSNAPKSNEILIVFSDTGKGIPEDKLHEVFDYFYSSKKKGTGLGLSIAQQIITEHKGKIQIGSKIESGTDIFIYLPKL
ncbi:ATP-binding protein [candidate division KSB1 bacterium]